MYFKELSSDSRLWVYQADRSFTEIENQSISKKIEVFISGWNAHGASLKAGFLIVNNHFIVLSVDEKFESASGCSIDSSVKIIKEIGKEFSIDFFNRLKLIVENDSEMKMIAFADLIEYQDWNIYNTLVNTVEQFNNSFLIPVKESELFKMIC